MSKSSVVPNQRSRKRNRRKNSRRRKRVDPDLTILFTGEDTENLISIFLEMMQLIVDQSGAKDGGLLSGIPITDVKSKTLKEELPKITKSTKLKCKYTDEKGFGLIAEDFSDHGETYIGMSHYFAIHPSKGVIEVNRRKNIINNPSLTFNEIIENSATCNTKTSALVVANGYTDPHLDGDIGECIPGIGLSVQPNGSHDLCAIYSILFLKGGLDIFRDFKRLRIDDDRVTQVQVVRYNAHTALGKIQQLLKSGNLYDKEYTTSHLEEDYYRHLKKSLNEHSIVVFKYSDLIKAVIHPILEEYFSYWSNEDDEEEVEYFDEGEDGEDDNLPPIQFID